MGRIRIKKILFIILGWISLGLGAVGVVLPVLPTTPFVLLSAICFSSGSKKMDAWLQNNRVFGPYIENYRTGQGIKKSLKIRSVFFLWTGLAVSMAVVQAVWVYVVLAVVGLGVTVHILSIKTKK
jgi:hypothetical protein